MEYQWTEVLVVDLATWLLCNSFALNIAPQVKWKAKCPLEPRDSNFRSYSAGKAEDGINQQPAFSFCHCFVGILDLS
jgi:hypothetical protein